MKATALLVVSLVLVTCPAGATGVAPDSRAGVAAAQDAAVCAPAEKGSVRFAVIGDSGTGGTEQREVGAMMFDARATFPFDHVLMVGDNLYGSERPQDYEQKFEVPYKPLLDEGVKFHAALGNHDDPNQRYYKPFNMNGERYYAFEIKNVRFFALDTNYLDPDQIKWLERELQSTSQPWKIVFFHHPLYSSGKTHGSAVDVRNHLEPLFIKYGVSAVFAGHEHLYERVHPQNGIYYFTSGAAAKLRKGDLRPGLLTAKGLDTEYSFMLIEVDGDEMRFQTVTRTGKVFDSGLFTRPGAAPEKTDGGNASRPAEDPRPLVCKPAA